MQVRILPGAPLSRKHRVPHARCRLILIKEVHYAADWAEAKEADYDFLIDNRKVEIGGRKKDRKNAEWVIRDDVDLPSGPVLPLWILGLEY